MKPKTNGCYIIAQSVNQARSKQVSVRRAFWGWAAYQDDLPGGGGGGYPASMVRLLTKARPLSE